MAGKIRGARAKSMKFTDGYMIKSGEPKRQYIDTAVRVSPARDARRATIMLPWDPTGKTGPKMPLPDQVVIHEPKERPSRRPPRSTRRREGVGFSVIVASYVITARRSPISAARGDCWYRCSPLARSRRPAAA